MSYQFAVISAAVVVELSGRTIGAARLALGGVTHRPWRLPAAENALAGADLGDIGALRAARNIGWKR